MSNAKCIVASSITFVFGLIFGISLEKKNRKTISENVGALIVDSSDLENDKSMYLQLEIGLQELETKNDILLKVIKRKANLSQK